MQQLIFDGQQLEDEKLVFDYNIQRYSKLDLQLPSHLHTPLPDWIARSIQIFIETLTGKTMTIGVKGTDTINDVKLRIQNMDGTPPGEHSNQIQNIISDKFAFF